MEVQEILSGKEKLIEYLKEKVGCCHWLAWMVVLW